MCVCLCVKTCVKWGAVGYLQHAACVCEVAAEVAALVQALQEHWDAVPFGLLVSLLQQSLRELRKTNTNLSGLSGTAEYTLYPNQVSHEQPKGEG